MNQSGFHGMGAETSEQKYMSNEKTPWLFRGLSYPLLEGLYPITHQIHVWYIYLHLSHKVQPDVGKYTSSMDPMGYRNPGIPIFNSQ